MLTDHPRILWWQITRFQCQVLWRSYLTLQETGSSICLLQYHMSLSDWMMYDVIAPIKS